MSERDGVICAACGATWDVATARFCGRCGAALPVRSVAGSSTPVGPDDGDSPPTRARGARGTRLTVLIALGLIVVAVDIGSTTTWLEGRQPTDEVAVELPDASELPALEVPDRPQGGCIPDGCELWRMELDTQGWVIPGEGFLVHTTGWEDRDEGAPATDRAATVTVITMDGEVAWTRELERGQSRMLGVEGALPLGDLVLAPTADGLVAHAAEDGEVRWVTSELPSGAFVNTFAHAEDPIVAMEAEPSLRSDPRDDPVPRVVLARLDRATGEVVWRIDDVRTRGFTPSFAFIQEGERGPVEAVAVSTGERMWEREMPDAERGWWPQEADGRVVFSGDGVVEVVDASTGTTLLELADLPDPAMPVQLVGDLLVVGPNHDGSPADDAPRGSMALIDLVSDDPSPRWIEDVAAVMPLAGGDRWWGAIPSAEVEGLAVLSVTDGGISLELLEGDGSERWTHWWDELDEDCCPRLYPGLDAGSLVLAPRDPATAPARIIATADGELLDTVRLPADLSRPDVVSWHVSWVGPIATVHGGPAGQGPVIVGPGGRFTAGSSNSFGTYGGSDPLLVQLDTTLIALDVDALLGPSGNQARQR